MSERHALASPGAWVELRDPHTLKAGDKRRVMRAIKQPDAMGETAIDITDGLIMMLVVNWELPTPFPVPTSIEGWRQTLDLLEIADYDRLMELIGPAQQMLFPSTPAPTEEQRADAASPTALFVDSSSA